MKIIEVTDKNTQRAFLNMVDLIYKDDPNYVRPLDMMIEKVFDPNKNVFFNHGKCTRWILEEDGLVIGRIAAFINDKKAYTFDQPTGGMGFFECIDDEKVAFALLDKAKEWLAEHGMKAMDGPINFGENDNFWGCLVEGFSAPSIGMPYNPPYYKGFLEKYGFYMYFEQVTNELDLTKPFPERFWKIAQWVRKKPGFVYEHFKFSNAKKYVKDLKTVYDDAWRFHENFVPIDEDDLWASLEEAKAIIEEDFIWFVYHENKPVAFLVMYPDANQIFKRFNGKLNLWNKLRFLYYKKTNAISRSRITIMGVSPKYQRMGLESAIFYELEEVHKKRPYWKNIELSWVGDFNPKMRALHEAVGGYFSKRHYTYRCLFGEGLSKNRSTVIPTDTKLKDLKNKD
ncbi:MAG: GNAT family N-acetyltransferase [Bacteroidales bacterium]